MGQTAGFAAGFLSSDKLLGFSPDYRFRNERTCLPVCSEFQGIL